MVRSYHPDLRRARFIPRFSYGPRMVRLLGGAKPRPSAPGAGVRADEVRVNETTSIHLFRPSEQTAAAGALLWMHGGGHLFGTPEQDDRANEAFVRELGIVVAAVRYRLGSTAPAPASVEDCYAALQALVHRADEFGVDATRIAIGGGSAGGGVAAGLVLVAHDRGEIRPAFQLLVYPMLDDRTVTRTDLPQRNLRMWTPKSNRYGWSTYLGGEPGAPGISPYAAPARREDLSGLPPTWIGVGTEDLFFDEDETYARRLNEAGVPAELFVVPGAFHGFDALFGTAPVVRDFWEHQATALRRAGIA